MGDLVRDAFQASGIDGEMEKVLADAILQKWSEGQFLEPRAVERNPSSDQYDDIPSPPRAAPSQLSQSPGLDCAKVRVLSEQLWRRLERKYETRLQTWKHGEERQLAAMLDKLRAEYKQSLDAKHTQYNELMRRKEEEVRKIEDRLKEENRLEFEKRHMDVQREWREVEAERRDIRLTKEHLESAKANFALRMDDEETRIRREKETVERMRDEVNERARKLEELIKSAVNETERRERNWIADQVNEWNAREKTLNAKCEQLCERVKQTGLDHNVIKEHESTIKTLKADLKSREKKLAYSEGKVNELEAKVRHCHDYDDIKQENLKLRFELDGGVQTEQLKMKTTEVIHLERRLKLVEEAASMRVRELKLKLKIMADKLEKKSMECRKYRSMINTNQNVVTIQPSRTALNKSRVQSLSESISSANSSSSSFDRNLRSRLKTLDNLSYQLDVSIEKYRSCDQARIRPSIRPSASSRVDENVSKIELDANPTDFQPKNEEAGVPTMALRYPANAEAGGPTMASGWAPLNGNESVVDVDNDEVEMEDETIMPLERMQLRGERSELMPVVMTSTPLKFGNRPAFSPSARELSHPAENGENSKENDEKFEPGIDPVMQHYMNIVPQKKKQADGTDQKKSVEQFISNEDVHSSGGSVEMLKMDHKDDNSASDFDW